MNSGFEDSIADFHFPGTSGVSIKNKLILGGGFQDLPNQVQKKVHSITNHRKRPQFGFGNMCVCL